MVFYQTNIVDIKHQSQGLSPVSMVLATRPPPPYPPRLVDQTSENFVLIDTVNNGAVVPVATSPTVTK